jgi:hypothetical protein
MTDDFDAVKSISAILGQFSQEDKYRIIRWVKEKFSLDEVQTAVPAPSQIVLATEMPEPRRLRNPHLMAKPPLNKIIIQDDDDEGELLGIPADRDVPEPPEADILKPVKETRVLARVEDFHKGKDGKIVKSTSLVMR